MSPKDEQNFDTRLSRKLSYLLRHGAVKENLNVRSDGFVNVEEVLLKLHRCTLSDIERVVANNTKNRFTLRKNNDILEIKANQGHSIKEVQTLSLQALDDPQFDIIHGTYFRNWESIRTKGLSRMKRNHIHFAKGLNFICGLRHNAEIFIYIDFQRAKLHGLNFYESENNVILCPGNSNGIIEPQYFLRVEDRSGNIISSYEKKLIKSSRVQ